MTYAVFMALRTNKRKIYIKKRAAAKLNATPLCDFRMSAFSGLTSAHIFSITINSTVSASKVKSKVKPKAVVVCLADGAGHNGSPENNNFLIVNNALIADNALMISILLKINK